MYWSFIVGKAIPKYTWVFVSILSVSLIRIKVIGLRKRGKTKLNLFLETIVRFQECNPPHIPSELVPINEGIAVFWWSLTLGINFPFLRWVLRSFEYPMCLFHSIFSLKVNFSLKQFEELKRLLALFYMQFQWSLFCLVPFNLEG